MLSEVLEDQMEEPLLQDHIISNLFASCVDAGENDVLIQHVD